MIEIIQHSSDIRFGFKEQHIKSCMFCCPKLGKLIQEWKKRALLHACHSFCWLLSSVQMDPKQKVYATVLLGGATHAGISPLPCYQKKRGLDLWFDILTGFILPVQVKHWCHSAAPLFTQQLHPALHPEEELLARLEPAALTPAADLHPCWLLTLPSAGTWGLLLFIYFHN